MAVPLAIVINSRRLIWHSSVRGFTPYHIVEKPCCASQH
jgi:hypothetical protein